MAASVCSRRAIARSISSSPKTLFGSVSSPTISSFGSVSQRRIFLGISRLPSELACAQSLMPFYSATASALLTSMLSMKPGCWGYLSEGFLLKREATENAWNEVRAVGKTFSDDAIRWNNSIGLD